MIEASHNIRPLLEVRRCRRYKYRSSFRYILYTVGPSRFFGGPRGLTAIIVYGFRRESAR